MTTGTLAKFMRDEFEEGVRLSYEHAVQLLESAEILDAEARAVTYDSIMKVPNSIIHRRMGCARVLIYFHSCAKE